MSKPNLNPIFHLMGEMEFPDFVLVAVDKHGEPITIWRQATSAGGRVVQAYMSDWLEAKRQDRLQPGPVQPGEPG